VGRGRLTLEKFIEKANKVHEGKYLYAHADPLESSTAKIKIVCYKHGEFETFARTHLQGRGCPKCGIERARIKFKENTALRKECERYELGRAQIMDWINRDKEHWDWLFGDS
jgi:hypothetical protein